MAWARTNIHARESGVGTYTKTHTRGTGYTQKGHGIYLHMGPAPSVVELLTSPPPPSLRATARAGHVRVGMHGIYLHKAVCQHALGIPSIPSQ